MKTKTLIRTPDRNNPYEALAAAIKQLILKRTKQERE